jgi:type I restriction enzyme R subunit
MGHRYSLTDGPVFGVHYRHQLNTYLRLYSFLSHIVSFGDPELEKLYAYGRLLITKLHDDEGAGLQIDDELQLAFFRLTKTGEGSVSLQPGERTPVSGPTQVGTGQQPEEDKAKLSEIVDVLNDRFGTDFTSRDQLVFNATIGDLVADNTISDQARTNSMENFRLEFDAKALSALVGRLGRDEDVVNKVLADEQMRNFVLSLMARTVYEAARGEPG